MKKHIQRYLISYIALAALIAVLTLLSIYNSGDYSKPDIKQETAPPAVVSVVADCATTPEYAYTDDFFLPSPDDLEWKFAAYTVELCRQLDVNPAAVFAIMDVESTFRLQTISPTGDYGLMQINHKSHPEYSTEELLDPYRNITIGVGIYAELVHKYEDERMAIACYNMGEEGAKRTGYASEYAELVFAVKEEYVK